MKRIIHWLAIVMVVSAQGEGVGAQTRQADTDALRANVERRFDVLPLRDGGVALRPRNAGSGIRSIEVTDGPVALDGEPATGAELRNRLGGADADLVLALTYLSADERRALFSAAATTPAPAVQPPSERRGSFRVDRRGRFGRDGDRIQIGSSVNVREGEVVSGDVVAVGGSVTVDGEVQGDVVSIGGGITLGPKASVENNVVVVGGALRRDPASRIGGRVQEVGIGSIDFRQWKWPTTAMGVPWSQRVGAVFGFIFTMTRFAVLCLLAALVILLGPSYVERTGDQAAASTVKAGAIGLLAQLLFIPILVITVVVLVMTIVGIPLLLLLPFGFLALALVGLMGFTAVTHRVGSLVAVKAGWSTGNPYLTTILGIVAVLSPLILGRVLGLMGSMTAPLAFALGLVGWLAEYAVWTVGFGAVALERFGRRA